MTRIGITGGGLGLGHGGVRLTGGGALPFSDTFTRSDGVLGGPWLGGSTWQVVSGKAVNTPGLGADELFLNGAFDADTNWSHDATWTIAAGKASHAGAGSNLTQAVVTAHVWNSIAWVIDSISVGGMTTFFSGQGPTVNSPGAYRQTFRSTNTTAGWRAGTSTTCQIDGASVRPLTLAQLFNAINAGSADVDVSAAATITAGTQAGVVVNLDSLSSPANFVLGYHDGTLCKLEKCVAGTYTPLVSITTAYSAGAAVRVVKSGTTFKLYYGASQVGTDQTVSDATVISNNYHGLFSSYEGNTLDAFSVTAV